MSEENKALVRRYIQAVDENMSDDWDMLEEFLGPTFTSHGGLPPGVGSDRRMSMSLELSESPVTPK